MSRFIVENITNEGSEANYRVLDTVDGWFFPTDTESEADFLCEELNGLIEPKQSTTIEDYFNEWDRAVSEISTKELELINIKELYAQQEQDILTNTDFKELYGANNEKVRKNHIKQELKDVVEKKQELELSIEYLKRRIDFIKNLMKMQSVLIEYGALE